MEGSWPFLFGHEINGMGYHRYVVTLTDGPEEGYSYYFRTKKRAEKFMSRYLARTQEWKLRNRWTELNWNE